jgi:acyl-CoA hydrolase
MYIHYSMASENQQPTKKGKKYPNDSKTEMTIVMLPSDANPKGNVFGGVILKHVDLIASLCAKRHSGRANVVTTSIDRMTFLKPVFIGNALILSARINYIRRSSMEVEVTVEAEDLDDGTRVHTGTAFVTMVNVPSKGKEHEQIIGSTGTTSMPMVQSWFFTESSNNLFKIEDETDLSILWSS